MDPSKNNPPVFVLGVPRSGTTLLRVMLEGHSRLFSPPEMILAPYATMDERRQQLDERFWEKGGLRRALMTLLQVDVDGAKAMEADMQELSIPQVYQQLQQHLGDRILVGMGAMIMDDAVVNSDIILGAGALVPPGKELESGYLYVGSPVRQARKLSAAELEFLVASAHNYVGDKNQYIAEGYTR